jgi:hypothetical protein
MSQMLFGGGHLGMSGNRAIAGNSEVYAIAEDRIEAHNSANSGHPCYGNGQ